MSDTEPAKAPRQAEASKPASAPARQEKLWVIERADDLFGEVANALWLAIASSWRVPIALCRANGLEYIKELVNSRRILPPRVGMLVAALASALMMVMLVAGGMSSATSMAGRLASASPEAWLAVAAPALLSL
ncbi:hypothetical protein LC605_32105, partial [Nostoc sp. CHAB 5836]|uniref:hypothetical protein n=1 Tax=Nostoc sp. CHAB 5836 TaxID=2780404 RepID=UPI001E34BA61